MSGTIPRLYGKPQSIVLQLCYEDFTVLVDTPEAGDLGPEGIFLVKEDDSPIGKPLLVVGNEISGTTTSYQIEKPGR